MQGACRLEEPSEQSPSSGGYLFFYCTFFLWAGCRRHCEMHICKVIETASISEHLSHFLRSNIGLVLITLNEKEQSARVTFILKARFLKLWLQILKKCLKCSTLNNLPWASKNGGAVSGTWIFWRKTSKLTLSRSSEPKIWSLLLHLHVF